MAGPNPVQFLPQNTPFTLPKEGKTILIVTSTIAANLTFKASDKGRKLGYPAQFSITQPLNASLPVEGGFFDFVTLTNNATVTVTFAMDISKDYLAQITPISPDTPYLNSYNTTQDTLLRSIERIAPRNGVVLTATVDLSVAAGASATIGPYSLPAATYLIIQGGISQDALGTTPHASKLQFLDPNNNPIYAIKGAVNNPLAQGMYAPRGGDYNIYYLNGDTVAHWFFLNVYGLAT